ncbi:MAG: hypothetical protein QNJ73_15545 [Gammaproteobacteria bacterium]|nr:hypothetical protein [Gammaproteobacteria bacterium]
MITYFYWAMVFLAAIGLVFLFGARFDNWRAALISAGFVLFVGWAMYFFYFQQIFVKRWGGVMAIRVPDGQYHIASTWKDDNLWIENYDPVKNECLFYEYSKGNVLQGEVTIKNCNPLHTRPLPAGEPVAP